MVKNLLQMSFRLPALQPLHELCHVHSAGHYIVQPGFRGITMRKDFLELFWGVSGTGNFAYGDQVTSLKPGEVCCYFPGDYHDIYAGNGVWEYCWITFDGPDVDLLIRQFQLSRSSQQAGPCPVNLFGDLLISLLKIDMESAAQSSIRGYEILTRASNHIVKGGDNAGVVSKFCEIVEREFGNPSFSIEEAAAKIGIHRSSLHRIFVAECRMRPIEYLLSFRINQACNLLSTDMTIKAIAGACGFADTNYFTKLFRRYLGKPPAVFRDGLKRDTAGG